MNWNLVGSIYGRFSMKITYFVLIHLQTWPSQAILVSDWPIFKNLLLRNHLAKWNYLWRPCLLTDRDEMSIIYREPSIDASYHVSGHLAKWFQRRRFFRNKNCRWWPCLLTEQDEISKLYRGPILFWSIYKHGRHRQFLFLIGRFLKIFSSETT
jgi:hypothetical protein